MWGRSSPQKLRPRRAAFFISGSFRASAKARQRLARLLFDQRGVRDAPTPTEMTLKELKHYLPYG
jgi:hypothetical protein